MRRKILLILFFACNFAIYAQVGIGTKEPHISSILELNSSNKGLLIPQIELKSLSDRDVIEGRSPKIGLLVFNTTSIGNVLTPGYYYWGEYGNDRKEGWIRLGDDTIDFDVNRNESLSVDKEGILHLQDSNGSIVSIPLIELQLPSTLLPHKTKKGVFVYENEVNQKYEIHLIQEIINHIEDIFHSETVINYLVDQLKDKFGNVIYENNKFYYLNDNGDKVEIDWKDFNTKNVSFKLIKDELVITDSDGETVKLAVEEIAKSDKFVTELVNNQFFITELTENSFFIEKITTKKEFITKIINQLKGEYGNVFYENNKFYYLNENGDKVEINLGEFVKDNQKYTSVTAVS
ncbi:hypothetical protein AAEZ63_13240, partial [Myroides sp. C2723]